MYVEVTHTNCNYKYKASAIFKNKQCNGNNTYSFNNYSIVPLECIYDKMLCKCQKLTILI